MSPKTKAIWKTVGAVLAGALTFAYLPLVSFAAVHKQWGGCTLLLPQFTHGWVMHC